MPLAELAQDLMDDTTGDVGQAIVSAGVPVRQAFMIKSHQVQNCGMKIVNMHDVFGDVDAVRVRFSVRDARLYAAAGQPG